LIDHVAAGSLVAGLFVIVVLFHYLPQMESFKAYGVEAKWREKISEADEILKKLRQSTLASAKLTYLILVQRSLVRIILGSLGEFVRPGVDNGVAIDVLDTEHDAFLELLL
jgi:hypothetical protein